MIVKHDEWIKQCIERNYSNSDFIYDLFEVLADFPTDRRRTALLKFLELNSNYDDFEKIPLESSSLSGSGSLIPCMQNRINYLSSLYPYMSGVKYLKHRQRVESCIDVWKECIKREEVRELLEDWF